jgi:N-acetyl-gamma-glutamyl-phosphate reductase
MSKPIKIGIIGAAGYTGGELLRILIHHPQAHIAYAYSRSQAGKPVYSSHGDLLGDTDLKFTDTYHANIDVAFLCSGHGESKKFMEQNPEFQSVKIIDLSTDYRDESEGFVYGLPEYQSEKIATATKIANPGCFATSIELGLLPLANAGLIKDEIHVNAITGSTGAGQSLSDTSHFSWRNNNASIYKAFTHQHLKEIGMVLGAANGRKPEINFIPQRGNFSRGIMANIYTKYDGSLADATALYQRFYQYQPFTHVADGPIDLKQVVNTNKSIIALEKHGDKLLITSIIDNLCKGASGQAVQNMNLMFGLEQSEGLRLKSVGF